MGWWVALSGCGSALVTTLVPNLDLGRALRVLAAVPSGSADGTRDRRILPLLVPARSDMCGHGCAQARVSARTGCTELNGGCTALPSQVVRIVDVCPCSYPSNAYNNKRWCCGDRDHFDVSVWAFEVRQRKWVMACLQSSPCCLRRPAPTPGPDGDTSLQRQSNLQMQTFELSTRIPGMPIFHHTCRSLRRHVGVSFQSSIGQ